MSSEVRWKICWENELEASDHAELADFFARPMGRRERSMPSRSRLAEAGVVRGPNAAQSHMTRTASLATWACYAAS